MLVKHEIIGINRSTKQEIVSDAAFKAWPLSSDFSFACKNS